MNKKTGNGFVDSLVKDHAKRKQIKEAREAEESSIKAEYEEKFNLRKMEIEERIYKPLLNVVKDYNDSIVSDGMILEQMEYNIKEETISFKFIDKIFDDGDKYATKVLPYWNGNDYLDSEGNVFVLENVSCGGYQGSTHNMIQNCEISYSGGILQSYSDIGGVGIGRPNTAGWAVHIAGSYEHILREAKLYRRMVSELEQKDSVNHSVLCYDRSEQTRR